MFFQTLQQNPYIKVKGKWRYLYRAIDRVEQTLDIQLLNICDFRKLFVVF
ncbi:hypothetical protein BK702_03000 [Bacillus thuringiensis serovar cameroun]|nr:hypothetical protein BK702_03000 [Bacillus thuringiensis serovar cameroun]